MMFFHVAWGFAVRQAGIAGEGSVMERRWDQKLLVGPRKDVGGHHQGHDYQSKNEAASLSFLETQQPAPALAPLSPHLENSKQVHLLTVHTKHYFVLSFARGTLLATVWGASLAADLLFVCVVGWQLYAAVNAVPHGSTRGRPARRAMGKESGACRLCCDTLMTSCEYIRWSEGTSSSNNYKNEQVPKHARTRKGVLWFDSERQLEEATPDLHVPSATPQPLEKPQVQEQSRRSFRFFPWHKTKRKNSHQRTRKHPRDWQISWSRWGTDWHTVRGDAHGNFFFYIPRSFAMFPLQEEQNL